MAESAVVSVAAADRHAAVHREHVAGDERAGPRREEDRRAGDLVVLAPPYIFTPEQNAALLDRLDAALAAALPS